MNTTQRRIGLLIGGLVLATLVVLAQLGWLMVAKNDVWTLRSYGNRWTFRDVPTHRGAILDRQGHVLTQDQPVYELLIDYQTFRRLHPVGAAVHGATLLADYTPGLVTERYGYVDGPLGPEAACRALLELPLLWLRARGGSAQAVADRRDVRFYCVSLLSACSGRSRSRVYRELRQTEKDAPQRQVGEALPGLGRDELSAAYDLMLGQLRTVDRELQNDMGHIRRGRGTPDGVRQTLMRSLDECRDEWFAAQFAGETSRMDRLRLLADRVAFELAAGLRTLAENHSGLWLEPSVVREPSDLAKQDPLLRSLLGSVQPIDRLAGLEPGDTDKERDAKLNDKVGVRRAQIVGDEELADVVPDELASDHVRVEFRNRLISYVEAMVRNGDRHGGSGVEKAMDDVLAGEPGLRLVERDKRAREQVLWSRLEVRPGADVRVSIDLELQALVAQVVRRAGERWSAAARLPGSFGAAMAVLDAATGEVRAVAGDPLGDDSEERKALQGRPLGLNWRQFGELGSVVKPFMLLEQLQAEGTERRHLPLAEFQLCDGKDHKGLDGFYKKVGTETLRCLHADFEAGRNPELALMKSCNVFFFQVAEGLGSDGVERALRRFGLMRDAGEFPAGTYEPWPVGAGNLVSPPTIDRGPLLQKRAIGYGICASPLLVARAYAALATGVLRPATFVIEGDRPAVSLDVTAAQLQRVHEGLRLCVEDPHGTAYDQPALRRYGVCGKTGTAEVTRKGDNNAWFAGFLPYTGPGGVQLAFAAVVYCVPDRSYGADAAGPMVGEMLDGIAEDPVLQARYQLQGGGR